MKEMERKDKDDMERKETGRGEPVSPTDRDIEREVDPTKSHKRETPQGDRPAPDMGGDIPSRGTGDMPEKEPEPTPR